MNSKILKIIILHAISSVLWIIITDLVVINVKGISADQILMVGTLSALVYVILTVFILFRLINFHYRQLETSEKQYRSYFEDNPAPMWIYDRKTLKFLAVNDATVFTYGYTKEEFYQMTILDIRPPGDAGKVMEAVQLFKNDYKDSGTWNHRKKDGTDIYVHITSHLILSAKGDQVMIMADDITKRLETETQLHQINEELIKQNYVLREISWSESHNVRRPLASILGLINIIRTTNDEKEKELCINYIDISATELDMMIHDIIKQINNAVSHDDLE